MRDYFWDSESGFIVINHSIPLAELYSPKAGSLLVISFNSKGFNILSHVEFLMAVFDTLDHSKPIYKLSHYGIKSNALKWFSSYLSNHTMYVEIDNALSSVRNHTTCVPQGYILGPLLFLFYMNDI